MPTRTLAALLLLASQTVNADDLLKPVLGIRTAGIPSLIDDERAIRTPGLRDLRLPTSHGVLVLRVWETGPAHAKLSLFDVITHVGRDAVKNQESFLKAMAKLPVGKPVRLRVHRFTASHSKVRQGNYRKAFVTITPISASTLVRSFVSEKSVPGSGSHRFLHIDAPRFDRGTGVDAFYTTDGSGEVQLWWTVRYAANSQFFVNELTFDLDGQAINMDLDKDIGRDNGHHVNLGGKGVEWFVMPATPEAAKLLVQMSKAKTTALTFHSESHFWTHELGEDSVLRVLQVLEAARLAGWKPSI